eukprot:m.193556 g.193556  ORF g.193556 m.193556 type:complete len:640 (-) comp18295_c1_seq1:920-2839(-)
MASLKELAREQLLDEVIGSVNPASGWKVLVVDHFALRMISACCRMFDIMDRGVTLVEDIRKSRQPLPKFDGLYLIEPTAENIQLIKKDFSRTPKYGAVHIFFVDACPDHLIKELASPTLKRVVKTVTELSLNFVPKEARVFSLDDPRGFYNAYSPLSRGENTQEIANQLASLCCFLGEKPVVRFSAGRPGTEALAEAVQDRLDVLSSFNPSMSADSRRRSQLIVLDRGVDLSAPLVHELTYQAAAYDLLDIDDDDTYQYVFNDARGREQSKRVVLNEQDDVWVQFRHHHLATVFSEITASFEAFRSRSAIAGSDDKDNTAALKQTMKELPQFQQQMAKFGLHLSMAEQINRAFTKDVERATTAEQNVVTGKDGDGHKVGNLVSEISSVLVNRGTSSEEKLRLVILCLLAMNGMKPSDLQQLQHTAKLSESQIAVIENLEHLGATVKVDRVSKRKKKKTRDRKPATEYALSRFVPVVKDIMENAAKYTLDMDEYPCVRDGQQLKPSKRADDDDGGELTSARRGGWTKQKKPKNEKLSATARAKAEKRQRIIIYIVGSVSLNELRSAYEVSASKEVDVFIGSQATLRPRAFLHALGSLNNTTPTRGDSEVLRSAIQLEGQEETQLTFVSGKAQQPLADDEV